MTTRNDIAELIFPDVKETIADLEKKFPPRANSVCSRFAPSPTGFLHIGGISTAFVAQKFVQQNKGTFFLRIEDTDQKREVEGAVDLIIQYLKTFGIQIDEGPLKKVEMLKPGNVEALDSTNTESEGKFIYEDVGNYGPYTQSKRKDIYQVFAKYLIQQGLAYPCRMSEQELEVIREQQTKTKVTPGIYGNYSKRRNVSTDEIQKKLVSADENAKQFVIRFRSHGDLSKRVVFDDVIKGKIDMIDNYNDIVLLKSDGLPTYHLAHIADDYLMRASHIIRAEERLTSVPLHLQLFQAFNLAAPKYCHVAPLLKLDNGNKRKLSKRHDPEADIGFFFQNGYASQGIIEYLLNLVDSKFEDRQKANPDKSYLDFDIKLEDMSKSGALFDFVKLQSVNNMYLSKISTEQLYTESLARAQKYGSTTVGKSELATLMVSDRAYAQAALNIERHTPKDPKRFTTYADIEPQLRFFFDSEWTKMSGNIETLKNGNVIADSDLMKKFVAEYISVLDLTMSVEDWFAQLKEIGKKYGFAGNNGEFKEGGYIGKIGDLAMFLRIQLCCATQTPDLYSVMQVMGKERVVRRLKHGSVETLK